MLGRVRTTKSERPERVGEAMVGPELLTRGPGQQEHERWWARTTMSENGGFPRLLLLVHSFPCREIDHMRGRFRYFLC